MSYQGSAWFRHTRNFLHGVDPHLAAMFERAMKEAGMGQVSEAAAFEAILADFLAGVHPEPFPEDGRYIVRDVLDEHATAIARAQGQT